MRRQVVVTRFPLELKSKVRRALTALITIGEQGNALDNTIDKGLRHEMEHQPGRLGLNTFVVVVELNINQ